MNYTLGLTMFDLQNFINCQQSLLIAPAGYGKTYTIASCLKIVDGKHLVLTHTNAGIASIYEKIKALKVSTSSYQIETISSFAQNIALSFSDKTIFPAQEAGKQYYKAIIQRATELIKLKPIRRIIGNSFTGLFVDEYQDCTISQHQFIQNLAEIFPSHLFGDPLQGIFNLDSEDPLVDLDDEKIMGAYLLNKFILNTPWRWKNQNRGELAEDLKNIRTELEINKTPIIDFSLYTNISYFQFDKEQLFKKYSESNLKQIIYKILDTNENILFIHSESANRNARIEYVTLFSNRFFLIESIDHDGFYNLAKAIDKIQTNGDNSISDIYELLILLFPKTDIEKWINKDRLTRKQGIENEAKYKKIKEAFEGFKNNHELTFLAQIIETIPELTGKKSNYIDIYSSLLCAVKKSSANNTSVYSEMVAQRNIARRVGRKLFGKSIGTTLLTKGLECDTVVLLEEKPFDYRNQYVALTRGCKQVIVIKINKQKKQFAEAKKQSSLQLSIW